MKPRAHAALARLLHQQRDPLRRYFQRRIAHTWDAQDLAQETCARLLAADRDHPAAIRNPEAYLYTIAANLLKQRRQEPAHTAADDALDEHLATPCQALADADRAQRLERLSRVLARLPEKCRQVLALRYREELDYRQIAARLGISTHMVKKYIVKGLATCRRDMLAHD